MVTLARLNKVTLLFTAALAAACSGEEGDDTSAGSSATDSSTTTESGSSESATDSDTDATSGGSGSTTGGTSATTAGTTAATTSATTGGGNINVWEMRMDDFSPPKFAGPTWYGCEAWTFSVPGPVHIVGFRPQVSDPHVHHYVVEMFDSAVNADPLVPCFESPFNEMVWGWAPGGEELMFPDNVGMRAGDGGVVSFRVQVHYNNPLGDDFADAGGFDVLWTDELREHEAGILTTGSISGDTIPAGDPAYEHVTPCSNPLTGSEPANVIGYWLHAHEIGKKLWTDLLLGGGGSVNLGVEDPYSFDQQTFKPLEQTINPGDSLETHCIYDASARTSDTSFGESTEEEMCINFVLYYPDGAMPALCNN